MNGALVIAAWAIGISIALLFAYGFLVEARRWVPGLWRDVVVPTRGVILRELWKSTSLTETEARTVVAGVRFAKFAITCAATATCGIAVLACGLPLGGVVAFVGGVVTLRVALGGLAVRRLARGGYIRRA